VVIAQLNAADPIVYPDGTMQPVFQKQMNRYETAFPIVGAGDPNGVVEGTYLQLYVNITGTTGSIDWRKMLPDVGGDKTLGWVAV
jgi:hypothetical protein